MIEMIGHKHKLLLLNTDLNFHRALHSILWWSRTVLGYDIEMKDVSNLVDLWEQKYPPGRYVNNDGLIQISFRNQEEYNLFKISFDEKLYKEYVIQGHYD